MFIKDLYEAKRLRLADKRIYASYYNSRAAEEVRPILDKLIESPKFEARWNFKLFQSMRPTVLKQKIYQGWNYLIDYLDPDERYIKLRAACNVSQDREGICIKRVSNLGQVVFTEVQTTLASPSEKPWKMELNEFLENSDVKRLIIGELNLSKDDEDFIKRSLLENTALTGDEFLSVIKPQEIKIMRKERA